MFGSFPPSPLVVSASKVYSGLGADIVYGIITLKTYCKLLFISNHRGERQVCGAVGWDYLPKWELLIFGSRNKPPCWQMRTPLGGAASTIKKFL